MTTYQLSNETWTPPPKYAELIEKRLIQGILRNQFPIDSNLPAERSLAMALGVTRPTLREALQRLARDGWIQIRQGKPTRVCNYLQEGNLAVLSAIVEYQDDLPANFLVNLLHIRLLLAPTYARLAVEQSAAELCIDLKPFLSLPEDATAYAQADWQIQRLLTIASGNPVFTLILNGFQELYPAMGVYYFAHSQNRQHSRTYYHNLFVCAQDNTPSIAEEITRQVMQESLILWQNSVDGAQNQQRGGEHVVQRMA